PGVPGGRRGGRPRLPGLAGRRPGLAPRPALRLAQAPGRPDRRPLPPGRGGAGAIARRRRRLRPLAAALPRRPPGALRGAALRRPRAVPVRPAGQGRGAGPGAAAGDRPRPRQRVVRHPRRPAGAGRGPRAALERGAGGAGAAPPSAGDLPVAGRAAGTGGGGGAGGAAGGGRLGRGAGPLVGAGAGGAGLAGGAAGVRPARRAGLECQRRRSGPADPAPHRTDPLRPGGQPPMSTEPTDVAGTAEPPSDPSAGTPAAENAYLVIGLAAVVVLGVALVQTGVGRWSVVPTLIGAAGLAFRWRSAPLVLLAAVALTQLGLVWMYGPGAVFAGPRGR